MRRGKRRNGRMKDERERAVKQFEILVTLVKVGGLHK
jgi:hypothetical protein